MCKLLSLFHHMIVDIAGNDGQRYDLSAALNNMRNFFVFHADNILPVYFQNVMVNQQPILCCSRIFYNRCNFAAAELETDTPLRILVQCDSSFEWAITNDDGNIIFGAFLQQIMNFIH